jgi:hypothetical protein
VRRHLSCQCQQSVVRVHFDMHDIRLSVSSSLLLFHLSVVNNCRHVFVVHRHFRSCLVSAYINRSICVPSELYARTPACSVLHAAEGVAQSIQDLFLLLSTNSRKIRSCRVLCIMFAALHLDDASSSLEHASDCRTARVTCSCVDRQTRSKRRLRS